MSRFYRLGLLGWPLGHSLSPRLHQAALDACGLEGEYLLYPVPPTPEVPAYLQSFLVRLRQGELHGLNVTIPHKQNALAALEAVQGVLTPAARAIGSVNTLSLENGSLVGDNTDAEGFMQDVDAHLENINKRQAEKHSLNLNPEKKESAALVLGAGGSARAITYALASAGWQVFLAARREEQALKLAEAFRHLEPAPRALPGMPAREEDLPACFSELSATGRLLVNTTPLGMHPQTQDSPWPAGLGFPPGIFVYDLVYNPPETALLRQARLAGFPGANGLGMLVGQAALSFLRWTGLPPDALPAVQTAMQTVVRGLT